MSNQDDLIPYIKISRSLFKHFTWRERRVFSRFEAWLDLIQRASFSDEKTEIIKGKTVERNKGQIVGSIRFFMEAWGWSNSKVSDYFEVLRSHNMISIDRLNGISIITLINYEKHSGKEFEQKTGKKTQKRQVTDSDSTGSEEVGDMETEQEATVRRQSGDSEATNIRKDNKERGIDKSQRPKGLTASFEADKVGNTALRKEYENLVTSLEGKESNDCWLSIKEFVTTNSPEFIEPYVDLWNIFALNYRLIKKPIRVTPYRRQKFSVRIKEPAFKFIEILALVKKSRFLCGQNDRNWKVDFEFIIHSEENYTKILEEKYDRE